MGPAVAGDVTSRANAAPSSLIDASAVKRRGVARFLPAHFFLKREPQMTTTEVSETLKRVEKKRNREWYSAV